MVISAFMGVAQPCYYPLAATDSYGLMADFVWPSGTGRSFQVPPALLCGDPPMLDDSSMC